MAPEPTPEPVLAVDPISYRAIRRMADRASVARKKLLTDDQLSVDTLQDLYVNAASLHAALHDLLYPGPTHADEEIFSESH